MNFNGTIKMLERGLRVDDAAEWRRKAARVQWCTEMLEKWWKALQHQNERCMAAVNELSEEAFERLCDEEQAKVDAIRAEIDAVIEHDRWPPHLHFSGI